MANWAELPEVVLGQILSYVDILDKFCVNKTCKAWALASFRPEAWRNLRISGDKLCLQISCNMMCLDEMISDVQICTELLTFISKGSPAMKHFQIMLCRWFDVKILEIVVSHCKNLIELEVAIWPNTREKLDQKVFEILHSFLSQKHTLQVVRIYDVPVNKHEDGGESRHDNPSLLSFRQYELQQCTKYVPLPFDARHAQHLHEVWLINSFKTHSLSNIMYLVNLTELAVNPQQLNYSLILHLASKSLRNLFIVANENTREFYNSALNDVQWKSIKETGPNLKVHCYFSCMHEWAEKDTIFKSSMPLTSLVYRKNVWLRYPREISEFLTLYSNTLEEFVDYSLSELTYRQGHETFDARIDNWLIIIARNCQRLKWLTVKEPLSSSTILLVATLNRNIAHFLVRDDMIIYKNDVPDAVFPDETSKTIAGIQCETQAQLITNMSELLNLTWTPLPRSNYFAILNEKYKKFK